MAKAITIGIKADGSSEQLFGTEMLPSEQKAEVRKMRADGLPSGMVAVEVWARDKVKGAYKTPPAAPAEEPAPKAKKKAAAKQA